MFYLGYRLLAICACQREKLSPKSAGTLTIHSFSSDIPAAIYTDACWYSTDLSLINVIRRREADQWYKDRNEAAKIFSEKTKLVKFLNLLWKTKAQLSSMKSLNYHNVWIAILYNVTPALMSKQGSFVESFELINNI